MGKLNIDESGNPQHPRGPETIAVAGVFAEDAEMRRLRQHVEQARRRAFIPVAELRYRLPDERSKKFFFSPERLRTLSVQIWAVTVRIADMAAFRKKHDPRALYEYLLYSLAADAVRGLAKTPAFLHFDPSSGFVSQREFARRLENDLPGARVTFSPDSQKEKGLQAADMLAGAARRRALGGDGEHWDCVVRECGAVCREMTEEEVREGLLTERTQGRNATSRVFSTGS